MILEPKMDKNMLTLSSINTSIALQLFIIHNWV